MSARLTVEVAEHVATVTLTRPGKHNALDLPMFEALHGAAAQLAGERGVRAVVLCGAGPSFCSGLDIASLMTEGSPDSDSIDSTPAGAAAGARVAAGPAADAGAGAGAGAGVTGLTGRLHGEVPNWFQRASHDWIDLPVPVIAALHGSVFGGGLQIAFGADIRIAAPDTRLSVMEVRWGLIPDMGITRTLPRLVSIDVAKELTWTGRTLTGEEAAALGLVTRVSDDPLAAARALAAEIATRSPDAVRRAKRLYDTSWTGAAADTLALEAELQLELVGSPNQLAAVAAGLSGEPAQFVDP